MKTITFYSYKGGVGRSLALVNIATRLVEFGKKVCVIDFDLEAPGLHLKFPFLRNENNSLGIVDYVYEFANRGILREDIKSFTTEITLFEDRESLSLITAGDTESSEYWKKLSSINWYDLIYENQNGLTFFLYLKEIIKKQIKPDFLLIDSRTGISEMSGVTLSLLADEVVILAANNKENLEGARRIIQSLNDPENSILGTIPNINFVLSRIPLGDKPQDRTREKLLINRIKKDYLSPYISDLSIIHSDRDLELSERIKMAYETDEINAQISIDYLILFENLTKNDLSKAEVKRFKDIRQAEHLNNQAYSVEISHHRIELINKAIELNKDNIDFYVHKAVVYFDMREYDSSISALNKALEISGVNIQAINLLVVNLIEKREFKKAEEYANFYLELSPNDSKAGILKAVICTKTYRYQEVIEICTRLLESDTQISTAYSLRGNALRLMGRFDEALEDVFIALELDSESIGGISTLAEIYAETGRINEFYIHFENALKLDQATMIEAIQEEEVYKRFFEEPRFIALLSKYDVYLDSE